MKLKILLLVTTLCLFLSFAYISHHIAISEYYASDILEVNDLYKNIEKDLSNKSINEIEQEYNCIIILRSDANYNHALYSAIRRGNVVLDYLEGDLLKGKIIFPTNTDTFLQLKRFLIHNIWVVFIFILIILYVTTTFVYYKIIHPFQMLQKFATHIAVGNLDIPLNMDKTNYFGAFTESFDLMRSELKKARQGEYRANLAKKELVAELSHDIKTPVSTIMALCEILQIKLRDTEVIDKINTINQKADVIDKLINNMFHATLEELEALKIEPREELSTIVPQMFMDINHYGKIQFINDIPGCLIYCDKLRLNQVIDNIINNSYKYANTNIEITFGEEMNYISIEIRDFGPGVAAENLPLLYEKFYRGENASSHSGSGLGLYLAKQFMEGMAGSIEYFVDHGFVVVLNIKKI